MTQQPRGFLGRLRALVRGIFGIWIRDRERNNPQAVYEQAIQERTRQYRELKQAVAGILYMRNKLQAEMHQRQSELEKVHEDIRRAVKRGEDDVALVLIEHKQSLEDDLERAEGELGQVCSQAEDAKGNLARFREEIRGLEREKVRTLATLANAQARQRMQDALDGLSVDADLRALESVREYVARVTHEGRLEKELEDDGLRERVKEIRSEARAEASRLELEEIKRRLVPQVLPGASDAAVQPSIEETETVVPVAVR